MSRFLTLLMILAFVLTNGPVTAMAMCQHGDARAHAAALVSAEASVSADAHGEETAAKAAAKKMSLADAASTLLAGFVLPPEPASFARGVIDSTPMHAEQALGLASRSVQPLLEPPLA